MTRKKRRKVKEGPLEKRWQSYSGTGITATKGEDALALRKALGGGGEFAIVKLYGGCWTNSPMKVLEVIQTSNLKNATKRFNVLSKRLGIA